MVEQEEQQREQVFADAQQLQDEVGRGIGHSGQLNCGLPDGSAVLDGPQESQDLSRPSHLDVDVEGGALGLLLRVEGCVLHEPQDLRVGRLTLSLL